MRKVYGELKRRNVVRVAVVYIIAAWIVMQVVDVMFPALSLPLWMVTAVAALILIGFPFAVIFAWAFELTPEGLKRERDVDRSQSITPQTGKKLNQLTISVLTVAVAFLVVDKFYLGNLAEPAPDARQTVPAAQKKSIAVLPFVNMSGDPANEYFSDGLSEELLNVLAKIPELHVAGRTSSFKFKGLNEDLRIIGDQLNVANVLEGSVRKSDLTVRITVQLVDTESGYHLWSETFDRQLTDIFAVQDEIARRVADELKVTLLGQRSGASRPAHGTNNLEAYNYFLQGLHFYNNYSEENLQKSIDAFEKAVQLDPQYARAWANLAISLSVFTSQFSGNDYHQGQAIVLDYAEKALQIDSTVADGYRALAYNQLVYQFDNVASERAIRQGLDYEPNNPILFGMLAVLRMMENDPQSAIEYAERSLAIDPLASVERRHLGDAYRVARQYDSSLEQYRRILRLQPDVSRVHGRIGRVLFEQGEFAAAEQEFLLEPVQWVRDYGLILLQIQRGQRDAWEKSLAEYIETNGTSSAAQHADLYAFSGNVDKAYEWLAIALEVRDAGLTVIRINPYLENVRADPRWPEFEKSVFGGKGRL